MNSSDWIVAARNASNSETPEGSEERAAPPKLTSLGQAAHCDDLAQASDQTPLATSVSSTEALLFASCSMPQVPRDEAERILRNTNVRVSLPLE